MWEAIKNIFERETLFNRLAARRSFYTAAMSESEDVITFITRVRQLASSLKSMGVTIDNGEMAMAVLNGLPDRFDSLISALDALGNDDKVFTLDFVKSRVPQEEQRMGKREKENHIKAETAALLARRADGSLFRTFCDHCKRPGHVSEKCWIKFPELRPKDTRRPLGLQTNTQGKAGSKPAALVVRDPTPGAEDDTEDYICLLSRSSSPAHTSRSSDWILDSGCSSHMTFNRSAFSTYTAVSDCNVIVGTKSATEVSGRGDVIIQALCEDRPRNLRLCNVLHVPHLGYQLLSVPKIVERGLSVNFNKSKCLITKGFETVASGSSEQSLFILDLFKQPLSSNIAPPADLQLWHERLAHVNRRDIIQMARRGVVKGISESQVTEKNTNEVCKGCIYGKGHQAPLPKSSSTRTSAALELVHTDVAGPISTPSLGGSRYFITFIDDFSKWTTVYTMQSKSESFDCFKRFHRHAETLLNNQVQRLEFTYYTNDVHKLKSIRSDNGGEYLSNGFCNYLDSHGIHHQLTVAYTPQQNGVAERMNRTLMDLVRSMLHHKNMDRHFWAEALSTAVYIRNRVTSHGLPANITPHHLWMGSAPDLSHLRVFGSRCWYILPRAKIKKLDQRAREAIMIGYSKSSKAYKLWDTEHGKIVVARSVQFEERDSAMAPKGASAWHNSDDDAVVLQYMDEEDNADRNNAAESLQTTTPTDNATDSESAESARSTPSTAPAIRRSSRVSRPPSKYWLGPQHSANIAYDPYDPTQSSFECCLNISEVTKSYSDAMSSENVHVWGPAIAKEESAIARDHTWTLVKREPGMNVLPSMYVFNMKSTGPKARIVAKGYRQVHGVDYGETYAPVVKFTSVCVMLAIVAVQDLELHQMDVVTAFLHWDVDKHIYMSVPQGFRNTQQPNVVCKLRKALYGLKQAPRLWHAKINTFLLDRLKFMSSPNDPCLYVKHSTWSIIFIALYVDDLLIAGNDMSSIRWINGEMCKLFEMKDLGESKLCLGLEISRDRSNRTLHLSQTSYIRTILERFNMENAKPVPTPMESGLINNNWSCPETQHEPAGEVPYRQAIGSLMFLMVGSRPDIAFSVCYLAKFYEAPLLAHWKAVKRVLRYISGTRNEGISYGGMSDSIAFGYSDADWGGCKTTRRSTSGYLFLMSGGPISWRSRKQTVTATSSCKAEYIAACTAAKEAGWLARLIADIKGGPPRLIVISADNQGCIDTTTTQVINQRNKHVDIQYHYVRDLVQRRAVSFKYCSTEDMTADTLTNPLERVKFVKHKIGMSVMTATTKSQ